MKKKIIIIFCFVAVHGFTVQAMEKNKFFNTNVQKTALNQIKHINDKDRENDKLYQLYKSKVIESIQNNNMSNSVQQEYYSKLVKDDYTTNDLQQFARNFYCGKINTIYTDFVTITRPIQA